MPFSCMHSWKRISSCEFRPTCEREPTCSRLQNTFLWWHQQQFQATQQEVLNPCHTCNFIRRFCHDTLSHDNYVCNCACRTLQLLCINKNWPISVHRTFMAKLHRIEFWSIKKGVARLLRSCATRHVTLAILSSNKIAGVTSYSTNMTGRQMKPGQFWSNPKVTDLWPSFKSASEAGVTLWWRWYS